MLGFGSGAVRISLEPCLEFCSALAEWYEGMINGEGGGGEDEDGDEDDSGDANELDRGGSCSRRSLVKVGVERTERR